MSSNNDIIKVNINLDNIIYPCELEKYLNKVIDDTTEQNFYQYIIILIKKCYYIPQNYYILELYLTHFHFYNLLDYIDQDPKIIIKIAISLLHFNLLKYKYLWNWSILYKLITTNYSNYIRYYATLGISMLLGLSMPYKNKLLDQISNNIYINEIKEELDIIENLSSIIHQYKLSSNKIISINNNNQQQLVEEKDLLTVVTSIKNDNNHNKLMLSLDEISKQMNININNIQDNCGIILTSNIHFILQCLNYALYTNKPILLKGDIGCGKTSILHAISQSRYHVNKNNNNKLITIHFDQNMDSKTLIGTYSCTDIPGEFIFKKGTLTNAIELGHWVLLEDINNASFELISALIPLFEKRRLYIPQRGKYIQAHKKFQLFASITTNNSSYKFDTIQILDKYFTTIIIPNISLLQLKYIIQEKWFKNNNDELINLIINKIVIYFIPAYNNNNNKVKNIKKLSNRILCSRDILKLSKRLYQLQLQENNPNNLNNFDIFICTVEVLISYLSIHIDLYQQYIYKIAEILSISNEKVNWYINTYKPRLIITNEKITIGNTTYIIKKKKIKI